MSQQFDWQKLSENERKRLIHRGQTEIDEWRRKIDEKQKLLCEKRETIPAQCENALLKERVTLLEHFTEGEIFVPGPHKPNLDSQVVINEIQKQLRIDQTENVTETELRESIAKTNEEAEKLNFKCIEMAESILRMSI